MEDADEYYGKKMSCGVSAEIITPAERLELENLSHQELIVRLLAAEETVRKLRQVESYRAQERIALADIGSVTAQEERVRLLIRAAMAHIGHAMDYLQRI